MTRTVWFPDDEHLAVCILVSHPTTEVRTEEMQEELWYSARDFSHFRCTARLIAHESQKLGLGNFLAVAGAGPEESPASLIRWAQHHHSTRGLERLCNPSHGRDRKMRQKECIRSILKTQKALHQLQGICKDAKCLIVARTGAKHSKQARRFASLMGLADAFAAADSGIPTVWTFVGRHHAIDAE